jgi:hypothetical protein
MNTIETSNPDTEDTLQARFERTVSSPSSIWAMRRLLTLALGLALIGGGAWYANDVPAGLVDGHLIDRHIAIGAAVMVGGFLLLAVYVLTGILADQPSKQSDTDRDA